MKILRLFILIVGLVCTIMFCSVNYRKTGTAEKEITVFQIGFPTSSPWFNYERSLSHLDSGVRFISWSSLAGFVVVLSFYFYYRSSHSSKLAQTNF